MTTKKPRRNIYLEPEIMKRAEKKAEEMGVSFGTLVTLALNSYLSTSTRPVYMVYTKKEGQNGQDGPR